MIRPFLKIVLLSLSILFLFASIISCSSASKKPSSLQLPSDIQVDSALCRDTTIESGLIKPVKTIDNFCTGDTQVVIWVTFENTREKMRDEHQLRWEWIAPNGELYVKTEDYPITNKGYEYEKVTSAHKIGIRGEKAERLTGKWQVIGYLDGFPRVKKTFTISEGICDIDGYISEGPKILIPTNEKKWGVIIGIEHYQKAPSANYATGDAEIVRKYLANFMSVPEGHIYMLLNEKATKFSIEELLGRKLPERVKDGDTVYFYYSGHGVPDEEKNPYLLPVDGDPYSPESGALSIEKVYANLGSLKAKNVYAFIDACFIGTSGRSEDITPIIEGKKVTPYYKDPILATKNLIVISAAEKISNFYKVEEHGLFTYYLLRGLLGEADYDRNGHIHAQEELYKYISENVKQTSNRLFGAYREQEPVFKPRPLSLEIDPWIAEVK